MPKIPAQTVTKKDLADHVALMLGRRAVDVKPVVQALFDSMVESIKDGKRVEIRDVFVLDQFETRPRRTRNPKNPEQRQMTPAYRKVQFKAGRLLRKMPV